MILVIYWGDNQRVGGRHLTLVSLLHPMLDGVFVADEYAQAIPTTEAQETVVGFWNLEESLK